MLTLQTPRPRRYMPSLAAAMGCSSSGSRGHQQGQQGKQGRQRGRQRQWRKMGCSSRGLLLRQQCWQPLRLPQLCGGEQVQGRQELQGRAAVVPLTSCLLRWRLRGQLARGQALQAQTSRLPGSGKRSLWRRCGSSAMLAPAASWPACRRCWQRLRGGHMQVRARRRGWMDGGAPGVQHGAGWPRFNGLQDREALSKLWTAVRCRFTTSCCSAAHACICKQSAAPKPVLLHPASPALPISPAFTCRSARYSALIHVCGHG